MLLCNNPPFQSCPYIQTTDTPLPTVCPTCANVLTVSRAPSTISYPEGQNRLECRTCPYEFHIKNTYFERTAMKKKEVEDVIGGKDAWENVDKADGEFCGFLFGAISFRRAGGKSVKLFTRENGKKPDKGSSMWNPYLLRTPPALFRYHASPITLPIYPPHLSISTSAPLSLLC